MDLSQNFTDKVERKGYISKESILKTISQEEIFKLVFGFIPKEFEYVVSPLRSDSTPGAWFYYHVNGVLYFVDFGNTPTHRDCFSMVQTYFKIPNFYLTLEYIVNTLIKGKELKVVQEVVKTVITEKPKVKILTEARPFNILDKNFWSQYKISRQNLMDDKVFAIKKCYSLNTRVGTIIVECRDLAYSYNDFSNSKKKIYFPERQGKHRFITNCSKDDIGGINSLLVYGEQLIITKSYKDYRVLKNKGKNVVWFQNEGMIPSDKYLKDLATRFKEILIWYDNDIPGKEASEKLKNYFNSLGYNKIQSIWLPESLLERGIKDPSDCIFKDENFFNTFIKNYTK